MKNRFSNNDDDDEMDEDMEEYFDMDDLEGLDSSVFMDAAHVELVNREQDVNILRLASELVGKSWFFNFYSLDTKLNLIDKAYSSLIKTLDKEEGKDAKLWFWMQKVQRNL